MSGLLDGLVSVAAVLVGAGITYALNVRARRESRVEELFNEAMAAVAVARASRDYMSGIAVPHLTTEEHHHLLKQLSRDAVQNHVQKVAVAREALARLHPYRPDLERYWRENLSAVYEQTDEIIAALRRGPVRGVLDRRRANEGE